MRAHIERNLDAIAEEPSEDEVKRLAIGLEKMSEEERAAWFRQQALRVTVMDEMMEEARELARHEVTPVSGAIASAGAKAAASTQRAKPRKHARRSSFWGVAWRVVQLIFIAMWCGLGALFFILWSIRG